MALIDYEIKAELLVMYVLYLVSSIEEEEQDERHVFTNGGDVYTSDSWLSKNGWLGKDGKFRLKKVR